MLPPIFLLRYRTARYKWMQASFHPKAAPCCQPLMEMHCLCLFLRQRSVCYRPRWSSKGTIQPILAATGFGDSFADLKRIHIPSHNGVPIPKTNVEGLLRLRCGELKARSNESNVQALCRHWQARWWQETGHRSWGRKLHPARGRASKSTQRPFLRLRRNIFSRRSIN